MTRVLPSLSRFAGLCLLSLVLLCGGAHAKADPAHPLEPVDTSTPRATLTSFLVEIEGVWQVFRDEY